MELDSGNNILCIKQLTTNGIQASTKEKKSQIDHMKEMCFLISAYQKRYSFLLKHLRYRDNVGRDEYPVTTTLVLDLLIRVEFGIHGNQKST